MFRETISKISARNKLIMMATVAVLLPLFLLTYVQYRSLVELEKKTKIAFKENLRQSLLNLERELEEKFEELANRSLVPVTGLKLSPEDSGSQLEKYFSAVKESHPEIEQIFAFSYCGCEKDKAGFGYLHSNGFLKLDSSDLKGNSRAHHILHAFDESRNMQNFLGTGRRFLFWQQSCSECSANDRAHRKTFVFYPLFEADSKKQIGFTGLSLRENYVRDELLPRTVSEVLSNQETVIPDCSDIVLSVNGENGHEIFTSAAGQPEYIIESEFGRPFLGWKARIGFKDFNLDSLARDNFLQGLAATVLVLLILIAGMVLTVRATGREVHLAQMKSAFVSNVSHELKTPLSLIKLFTEMLELGRVKNEDKKREYYRIIGQETQRLNKLIDNILDFSKIEAGRKTYNFVETDVGEVIENVLAGYGYQIKNSGFELKTNISKDLPPVLIDRDAMAQAVLNLLDNAVKYSAERKEISIEVKKRDSFLTIEVTDCGMGIPRAEQAKIFEKFYRVGNGLVHNIKGSGLGLSLVKHIVEAHQGRISVESEAGQGSRFIIFIPLPAASADRQSPQARAGEIYKVAENTNH